MKRSTWVWLLVIVLFAGFVRALNLSFPAERYFDEIYYAEAADDYLHGRADSNTVHPPLGKIQIAAGVWCCQAFNKLCAGQVSIAPEAANRCASLLAGTVLVLFTFLLAWRLSRGRRDLALLAAFLVTLDFMAFTLSRICMLDMVQAVWSLIGAYLAWRYIEVYREGHRRRAWLYAFLCALAFGASTACKWNGLFAAFGAGLAILYGTCDASWGYPPEDEPQQGAQTLMVKLNKNGNLRVASGRRSLQSRVLDWCRRLVVLLRQLCTWRAAQLVLVFFFTMALVYFLSYIPLFMREGTLGASAWKEIYGYHELMLSFRYDAGQFTHNYLSYFWEWPLDLRPVWLYFEQPADLVFGIVTFGSPVFWLTGLLYVAESMWSGYRGNRMQAFVAILWLSQWLSWSISTTGGFIYYMLPCIPFMAIATAYVVCDWLDGRSNWMVVFYMVLIVGFFIFYYPFLACCGVSRGWFDKAFPLWLPRWR